MKRNQLLITHAAVFSVGIAAAMVANGLRDNSAATVTDGPDSTRSARTASGSSFAGSSADGVAGKSDRSAGDKGREISKRDARPLTEKLDELVRIGDSLQRQRALLDLLDTLGPDEFASFIKQYGELNHYGDTRGEYDIILRSWAKADPLGALAHIQENGGNRRASAAVLATWAGTDAAAAERWALENHDGDGPNPYMASVIRGIAINDLPKATELALAMPRSRERADALNSITEALMMQGTEAALAYPATIAGDDAMRGGLVQMIADRLADKEPDRVATWLSAMDNGEIQSRAARDVAQALAREDVTKASAWVDTLKPEARGEAARGIIPAMSASDIAGTARWVSGLAGTPGYDNVVEEFVWSCNTRAPEQSAAWIQGVADPNQQRRLYHRMLGEWARADAAAVKQWVGANNVPDDVRRRFSR
ncbi:MAG: hypothetical protein V4640_16735 [Verrucomicrobiota bacterium]